MRQGDREGKEGETPHIFIDKVQVGELWGMIMNVSITTSVNDDHFGWMIMHNDNSYY